MKFLKPVSQSSDNDAVLENQKETFIASLEHDLKNPTIAQMRALEMFLSGKFGTITKSQHEVLLIMLESCKYMYSMLGSMLSTYRCESGKIKLANEEISLSALTQECVDEMIYFAKNTDITINIKDTCAKETIIGDKIQLKRVIMNLLTNGIKYAYPKTTLFISLYNKDDCTCFSYENNSPYVPKDKQKNIFAKYVTYSGKLGIGLGLYSSKKIIEAHNGKLFMQSYADNRNLFGFKIPNDKSYINKKRYVVF